MEKQKNLIGKKIKEIRKKLSLTQDLFSEKIGIEPSSLSNIENGKSFPSMATVLAIAENFGIPFADFFDNKYLADEIELDNEILTLLKTLPYESKQLIYKIIKQF